MDSLKDVFTICLKHPLSLAVIAFATAFVLTGGGFGAISTIVIGLIGIMAWSRTHYYLNVALASSKQGKPKGSKEFRMTLALFALCAMSISVQILAVLNANMTGSAIAWWDVMFFAVPSIVFAVVFFGFMEKEPPTLKDLT